MMPRQISIARVRPRNRSRGCLLFSFGSLGGFPLGAGSRRLYINKSDSVTSQVCAYIDAHYREEIHREELGELVFLNTDYLSRIFRKEKGISISNYIIQKRVEEAKKLLTQSTLPINTVSLYVGYSNFSYFTKMFKDNTGYAPLEYRRSFSEK